jgi:hypothetical protein
MTNICEHCGGTLVTKTTETDEASRVDRACGSCGRRPTPRDTFTREGSVPLGDDWAKLPDEDLH